MEQEQNRTIAELETALVMLHRREMRLRSQLKSSLVSTENRQNARLELETLLGETRHIEKQILKMEASR